MTISPVSNTQPVQGSQTVQNQAPNKKQTTQAPTDTVHLSPAALAHLKGGGDKDHDGDSH